MTKPIVVAFVSGLVFALGLGVSGMTQPAKIIGFLDVFGGAWDPSLVFVMVGALAVHLPLYRLARARGVVASADGSCGPLEAPGAALDLKTLPKLLLGAGVFGVGWGIGGYCPGPAVVSIASAAPGTLLFVASMLAGMWLIPTETPDVTLEVAPPRVV